MGQQGLPVWSPDGTRIAYVDTSSGNSDVEVVAANGLGPQLAIAQTTGTESHPDWSPDSTRIVFSRNSSDILFANADGSGTAEPVDTAPGTVENPAWSPNGNRVAFGLGNFPRDIATVPLDGDHQVPVTATPIDESSPDWQRVEPAPGQPVSDTSPPETTIVTGPPNKTKKKRASFQFVSSEPGSTFQCSLDDGQFAPCASGESFKVRKGKHSFDVQATDAAGNTDPTSASDDWKVKKRKRRK